MGLHHRNSKPSRIGVFLFPGRPLLDSHMPLAPGVQQKGAALTGKSAHPVCVRGTGTNRQLSHQRLIHDTDAWKKNRIPSGHMGLGRCEWCVR